MMCPQVLEVSSPTAGSALLGPSQIHSLQLAQELTVRTTSAHGESSDSLPVHVPAKLAAIMAGPAPLPRLCQHSPAPPPSPSTSLPPSRMGLPKSPCRPGTTPLLDAHAAANAAVTHHLPHHHHHHQQQPHHQPHPHPEALFSAASYADAWASPGATLVTSVTSIPGAYTTSTPTVHPISAALFLHIRR